MDWKTFLSAFTMILFAELGDKTQLAAISMVCSTRKPWEVFAGAALALVTITAVGVVFGEALTKIVPQNVIHTAAAVLFIGIGVLMLVNKF